MNPIPGVRIIGKPPAPETIPNALEMSKLCSSFAKKLPGQKLTILDMPEMIAVETRFITNQVEIPDNIMTVHHLQSSTMPKSFTSRGTLVVTETNAIGINTDAPFPQRDRAMQTMEIVKDTHTVAIQCEVDYDIQFEAMESKEKTSVGQQSEMERFMEFVKQKTHILINGKQECLLCGEIDKTPKGMQRHMAFHWGPAVLCECCGEQAEHALLLLDHQCSTQTRNERKMRLFCPCPRCGISVNSKEELCEHLDDHTKLCAYQCIRCHRTFTNVEKLQRHQLINVLCFRRAHRERAPYAPIMRPRVSKRRPRQCGICRRRYFNSGSYVKHLKICIKRLLRKMPKPVMNGVNGNEIKFT